MIRQAVCAAAITADYDEGGAITFAIDTGDCTDSAGRFEFDAAIEAPDGTQRTVNKSETWLRTHDSSTAEVQRDLGLSEDERLIDVTVGESSCDCFISDD